MLGPVFPAPDMDLGFYAGLACIVILLGLIVAILLTPPAPDSIYLDDDDWPDHPAHSGAGA